MSWIDAARAARTGWTVLAWRTAFAVALSSLVATPARAGPLDIRLGGSTPAERAGLQALVDDFQAAHPDIQVRLLLTDRGALRRALPDVLASETPPDVVNTAAGVPLRDLARRGLLDDLGDLWKANNWWTAFPTTAALVAVDGHPVGLPYAIGAWGLFVRRDAFERAGLKTLPVDLSSLLTACAKLRKAGIVPIALGGGDGWPAAAWFDYIDLRANGFDFHQRLVAGGSPFDSADTRRAFMWWRQLIDASCFAPDASTTTEAAAEIQLAQGNAAMGLMPLGMLASIPANARAALEFRRFPTIDATQALAEATPVDAFVVAARARHRADARRFLEFAGAGSVDGRLATALGTLPANANAAVPGTLANLAASKAIQEAGAHRVQGFDRDTPPGMASAGVQALREFLAQPTQMMVALGRLDAARTAAAATAVAEPPAAAASKPASKHKH